jgi:hypothetical protein
MVLVVVLVTSKSIAPALIAAVVTVTEAVLEQPAALVTVTW